MKKLVGLMLVLMIAFSLGMCKKDKDDDDDDDKDPVKKGRDLLYDVWWHTNDGLGDYYFNSDGTYNYKVSWVPNPIPGTWSWWNDDIDSMKVEETGGGLWTIWFRTIEEHEFTMSQSGEDHQNIYL
ncbi:MAG: hypothetical protein H8E98_03940, partial [Bacteroidetes bacterium]|nr:hypothetical protein [Bacteroidota bacterium]